MAVAVTCLGCGKSLRVEESNIGRQAKCDQCGTTFTVSIALDGTAVPPPSPELLGPSEVAATTAAEPPPSGAAAAEAAAPMTFGHYVALRKLGAGAMGVVWLAHDPNLDRDVAIKVLPATKDEEYQRRFLREARLAAKLHHQNTVTVYDAGTQGDMAYIVMELVEGGTLDKAVSPDKPGQWPEVTRMIRDAALGLAAAHKLGLIHRDIKPENLMRAADGVTKVVDFGLARSELAQTRYTQQGMLLGTPVYMAPEVWLGEEADARSDLYSLVLSYYYLLTGRVPFDASTFAALGYQHRYEPLPDPRQAHPKLPDAVCRILLRGSAKEPDQRYPGAAELAAELDALLAAPQRSLIFGTPWEKLGGSSSAKPLSAKAATAKTKTMKPQPWAAGGRRSRPRRWKALALGAAGFCLLGVIFYVVTNHGLVKIEIADPAAKVAIKVDGDALAIDGLRKPLRIRAGVHDLEVTSSEFQTFTRSFTVKRGRMEVVRVTLAPRPRPLPPRRMASAVKPQPQPTPPVTRPKLAERKVVVEPPKTGPKPAEYKVAVQPPDAQLTATGKAVSITGEGAVRTVVVAEPDGQTKVLLSATKAGYKTVEQEMAPRPGESRNLVLALARLPAPPPKPKLEPAPKPKPAPEPPKEAGYDIAIETPESRFASSRKAMLPTVIIAEPDRQASAGETMAMRPAATTNNGRQSPGPGNGRPGGVAATGEIVVTFRDGAIQGVAKATNKTLWRFQDGSTLSDVRLFCWANQDSGIHRRFGPTFYFVSGSFLCCLDGGSGNMRWKSTLRPNADGQQFNALSQDKEEIVVEGNGVEARFDAATGKALARTERTPLPPPTQQRREVRKIVAGAQAAANSIGMPLTLIPAGEFLMGSGESAEQMVQFFNRNYGTNLKADFYKAEHPQHRVRITRPFYLGTYHVTRGQFRQFVAATGYQTDAEKGRKPGASGWNAETGKFEFNSRYSWRSTGFDQTDNHPVVNVSWIDAAAFCQWLSRKEGQTYRLPTEAEWEYACRAGTTTRYYSGDDPETLAQVGNVSDAAAKARLPNRQFSINASDGYVFTAPVGQFRPNAFGLYDMHGNACQWCADWYGAEYYAVSPGDDPHGPDSGNVRVIRGGSWYFAANVARCANRFRSAPESRNFFTGFRVARTP
jgi:formylglycine-generating enzyme required for sulfatase activity